MTKKKKDKTEKTCEIIKKQRVDKFTGEMTINFLNGLPMEIKKTIPEKF